jgi:type IV fimbrial biogenesis protein FimT
MSEYSELFSTKTIDTQLGFTLIELLTLITLLSVMLLMTLPMIHAQYYERELEHVARQWIRHAQFARQYAIYSRTHIVLRPRNNIDWNNGWQVEELASMNATTSIKSILAQYVLPANVRVDSNRFRDPHSGVTQIIFNPAGSAKTLHGGFVANRLILSHAKAGDLQRHIVLAASGRWRICDPRSRSSNSGTSC